MSRMLILAALVCVTGAGCLHHHTRGGGHAGAGGRRNQQQARADRPFPVGQVTDSFWETQQTNAEAGDFVFYDHEFVGTTAELAPGGKRHLEQVALRLEHVPFPVIIEQTPHNAAPDRDQARRQTVVMHLNKMGITNADERVVIANQLNRSYTAVEAEQAYYQTLGVGFGGGAGRRFGGFGGAYR